jgi:hypothetical protein
VAGPNFFLTIRVADGGREALHLARGRVRELFGELVERR